ncbi:30S ribosomal protein S18 [bacterium]|nr:30S ribosomal protein S18 [bacterium]
MQCYFCQHNIKEIDFKDTALLKHFIAASGKIKPRKKTFLCSKHQRGIAKAIKRARTLGLLSYTKKI